MKYSGSRQLFVGSSNYIEISWTPIFPSTSIRLRQMALTAVVGEIKFNWPVDPGWIEIYEVNSLFRVRHRGPPTPFHHSSVDPLSNNVPCNEGRRNIWQSGYCRPPPNKKESNNARLYIIFIPVTRHTCNGLSVFSPDNPPDPAPPPPPSGGASSFRADFPESEPSRPHHVEQRNIYRHRNVPSEIRARINEILNFTSSPFGSIKISIDLYTHIQIVISQFYWEFNL